MKVALFIFVLAFSSQAQLFGRVELIVKTVAPLEVVVWEDNVFFIDEKVYAVQKIYKNGSVATVISCMPAHGLAISPIGEFFISQKFESKILHFSNDYKLLETIPALTPSFLHLRDNILYYVEDSITIMQKNLSDGTVAKVAGGNPRDGPLGDNGPALNASLLYPSINFDPNGNMIICDRGHFRIRKIDSQGIITTIACGGSTFRDNVPPLETFCEPAQILFMPNDVIVFADVVNDRIRKLENNLVTTIVGGGANVAPFAPASEIKLSDPLSLALINDDLYFAEYKNARIQKVRLKFCKTYIDCDDNRFCTKEECANICESFFTCENNAFCNNTCDETRKTCESPPGTLCATTGTCSGGVCVVNQVSLLIIATVVPVSVAIVIMISGFIFYNRYCSIRKKQSETDNNECQPLLLSYSDFSQLSSMTISQIRIEETLIGEGNSSIVKRGIWNSQNVALKQLKLLNFHGFLQEVKILNSLRHPNVITLFGIYLSENIPWMVMEYAESGALNLFLQQLTPKPLTATLRNISSQVLCGMEYLESKNIIHCDLAARNLLVRKLSDQKISVKVSDFGMGKTLSETPYYVKTCQFPVKWASPEILTKHRFSSKSDVWSFGVVLWEIFSLGITPYPEFSNSETRKRVLKGYRMAMPNACPTDIWWLILTCWRELPEERPSFHQMLYDEFGPLTLATSEISSGGSQKLPVSVDWVGPNRLIPHTMYDETERKPLIT